MYSYEIDANRPLTRLLAESIDIYFIEFSKAVQDTLIGNYLFSELNKSTFKKKYKNTGYRLSQILLISGKIVNVYTILDPSQLGIKEDKN